MTDGAPDLEGGDDPAPTDGNGVPGRVGLQGGPTFPVLPSREGEPHRRAGVNPGGVGRAVQDPPYPPFGETLPCGGSQGEGASQHHPCLSEGALGSDARTSPPRALAPTCSRPPHG